MNALATAPGVIATPGKYYIGAKEVMEYLDCKQHLGHFCRVMIISRRTCHSQRLNGLQLHLIICRVSGCGSTNGIKKHGKANTFPRCLSGQQRTRASWRAFSRLTAKTLTRTYGMLLTDSRTRSRQNDWQRSTEKSLRRLICGWSR